MSKRSSRAIPKKYFPGLVRGTDPDTGKRTWFWRGKKFVTLREVLNYEALSLAILHRENAEKAKEAENAKATA